MSIVSVYRQPRKSGKGFEYVAKLMFAGWYDDEHDWFEISREAEGATRDEAVRNLKAALCAEIDDGLVSNDDGGA